MNFLLGTGGPVRPNLPPHLMGEGERAAALVEKATSDILLQVDWAAMMEVVDAINHASDQAVKREIVRQIRKRLQSRSTRVVHMALELAEAVVKNGDASVHREVATPKFMNTMARVARSYAERSGKENLEVLDKTLEVIQSWGETFLPASHTMPLFAELYHQLRREGLPFPKQYDETKAPVLTPPPSAPSMRGGVGGDARFGFGAGDSVDLSESGAAGGLDGSEAGLPPPELVRRAGDGEGMLRELLEAAQTREELLGNEALPQVVAQCQRLARALQRGVEARVASGSGEMLEEYFAANDGLQAALQLYTGIKDRKVLLPLPASERRTPVPPPKEEDLGDFLSFDDSPTPAGVGTDGKLPATAAAATAPTPTPPLGSRTPTPTTGALDAGAGAAVPRLAPSRRDSFDKDQGGRRQSFRRRSGSGGSKGGQGQGLASDFLSDVASLDISGSVGGGNTGVFASNVSTASSITDAPEFRTTASLPADPFASAPPVPILPPPRSIASPSAFPPPPAPASAFLSAPGHMTGAFAPQPLQQPAYASMASVGGGSISSSLGAASVGGGGMMMGGYQQPAQAAAQWGGGAGADPFVQPPAQGAPQQQQPPRPASYPQPTTATGGPAPAATAAATSSQNPFDAFPF